MSASEFTESERRALMESDAEAWRAVCTILMAIVSIGVCIAIIALLFIV